MRFDLFVFLRKLGVLLFNLFVFPCQLSILCFDLLVFFGQLCILRFDLFVFLRKLGVLLFDLSVFLCQFGILGFDLLVFLRKLGILCLDLFILFGQFGILGADLFILGFDLFVLLGDLRILDQRVSEEAAQDCDRGQRGSQDVPHGSPALPLVQSVEGSPDHRRENPVFFFFQFFQTFCKIRAADICGQRFPFDLISVFVCFKTQQFREAVLGFSLCQYGQDAVPSLVLNEVFQFALAPPALQVTRGTDADQPVAVIQGGLDIPAQIRRKRKFFLVAEHLAGMPGSVRPQRGGNGIGFDQVMQLFCNLLVGRLMAVADESRILCGDHGTVPRFRSVWLCLYQSEVYQIAAAFSTKRPAVQAGR